MQEVRRFEEEICYEQNFGASLCNRKNILFGIVFWLWKLAQSHVVPPPMRILRFGVVMQKIQTNFSKLFSRGVGGLRRKCVKNILLELDCAHKKSFSWSCLQLRILRQSNIVPPPTIIFQFEIVIQKI